MDFDVVIVGAGLVGASLARALAESGLSLALVEAASPLAQPLETEWDTRVYAVSPGSAAFLESLGAWPVPEPERVAVVECMEVYGDDSASRLLFGAYDAGLPSLAFIAEERLLVRALRQALEGQGNLVRLAPARCKNLAFAPEAALLELEDGGCLRAKLVVGADGGDSWVRGEAGIEPRVTNYRQLAVVAHFATGRAHRGCAFQWFRRDGVLALLPLPGNRACLVWSVWEEEARALLDLSTPALEARVTEASHGALGELKLITPPAAFPLRLTRVGTLVAPRLALVGDAAHTVHPLAGQGVNLGLRDARRLSQVLKNRGPADCGDYRLLRRYERSRKEDILLTQLVTHGLQRLFNNEVPGLKLLRNLGLKLTGSLPRVASLLAQHAVN